MITAAVRPGPLGRRAESPRADVTVPLGGAAATIVFAGGVQ
ncbi:hypothetical protein [Alloactinosynnema sp. L-07]|nr:hypothetical protein [Alloactinosynnema sp. L-07]CRK61804.1 hypothetical protein [Alloactinosynnema sp. L-07]